MEDTQPLSFYFPILPPEIVPQDVSMIRDSGCSSGDQTDNTCEQHGKSHDVSLDSQYMISESQGSTVYPSYLYGAC